MGRVSQFSQRGAAENHIYLTAGFKWQWRGIMKDTERSGHYQRLAQRLAARLVMATSCVRMYRVEETVGMQWSTAREAMQVIQSGQRIFVQGACATPTALTEALMTRGPELRDVE